MAAHVRTEQVVAPDGDRFDLSVFSPSTPGGGVAAGDRVPGLLLLQEIWGVGEFVKAKAAELAGLGYVVGCPDVFWRIEPNVELPHDDDGLARAFGYMQRFSEIPAEVARADLVAALEHVRRLPECSRRVGVMGYCLGGRLAYEVAATGSPDTCVSYYGSGIAQELDLAPKIGCPVLFQFGGTDPYIAHADVDAVKEAFAGRPGAEVAVHEDAGHAFENSFAPAFFDPAAAAASWPVTVEFLDRTLRR